MAEKEYIERDGLMQKFADRVWLSNHSDFSTTPTWNQAVQIVEDFPAADVQPVVTCADCKHWDIIDWVPNYAKGNEHFCPMIDAVTPADWFCADGKEREES